MAFDIPTPAAPSSEDVESAQQEGAALALGIDLEDRGKLSKLNEITRQDEVDTTLHKCIVSFIYLAAALVAVCTIVLTYHFLAPESWLFLSDGRVSKLKDFLFSGAVGAALSGLARKKILNEQNA